MGTPRHGQTLDPAQPAGPAAPSGMEGTRLLADHGPGPAAPRGGPGSRVQGQEVKTRWSDACIAALWSHRHVWGSTPARLAGETPLRPGFGPVHIKHA